MNHLGNRLAAAASATWVVMLLASCGANPQSAASRGDKAFQSAPAEVKAAWQLATASLQTNNFATTLDTLKRLHGAGLTPEQMKAIEETATATSDKMYAAANAGDPNAKKALEELRRLGGR
jgi:hypothetical protein